MTSDSTTPCLPQSEIETSGRLFDNWFDPIEAGLRDRVRELLQAMFEAELDEALSRNRYARGTKPLSGDSAVAAAVTGHRHGHRSRSLLGTFGKVEIAVPRARLNTADGQTAEWKSRTLRAYQRRTLAADALIAGCYLACTNTRRVRRPASGKVSSMFAWQVAKLGEQAGIFDAPAASRRMRDVRQFDRRGPRLEEATKAGIGATIGSAIILAVMLVVLHALPVGIG
jgi:putative transposase